MCPSPEMLHVPSGYLIQDTDDHSTG